MIKTDKAVAEMVFNSPPEVALQYFTGKKISTAGKAASSDAHAKTFIIAGETRETVLKDVYGELENSLRNGLTLEQFKENTLNKLSTSGWLRGRVGLDPQGKPVYASTKETTSERLNRIYEKNLHSAYAVGHYNNIREGEFEFAQYIARMDNRTRDSHRALHGRIFATNDPAFDLVASIPMTEFGCRCRLRGLTERKAEKIAKEMGVDLDKIRSQAKLQGRVKEVQSQSMGANYYELNLGGGRSFRTAVKWRNNPALSFWEERVVRANTQPERNYREVMRSINGGVEVFNAGRPLAVFNTGRMITNFDLTEPDAEEKLFERFIKDNNGSDGLVKVTDPLGKVRVFSKYSFTDRSKKPPESKIAKRGRHRFLNYMPEVVNDPDLIIVKNAVRGMPARTMYIKGYMDGRFIRGLVVVVDGQNVHQVVTAYSVNTKGNFPKIKKGEDWHSQKSPIGLDIKSILGDIVEKAKRGQDVEFELIYPENIDLLK